MNRRGFLGGVSAAAAGAILFYVQPAEQQIATLEGDVEALDDRVSALETAVAEADAAGLAAPGADRVDGTEQEGALAPGNGATVEGVGTTVSDRFTLGAGQYRVNTIVQDTGSGYASLILEVYDPSGNAELVFNEFGEHGGGPWEGSSIYQAPEDGEYFVAVQNTDATWSIEFEPF